MKKHSLNSEQALFLVIDLQEKLMKAMEHAEKVYKNTRIMLGVCLQLKIPVVVTEQYPKGLGRTVQGIAEKLGEHLLLEKTSFSAVTKETLEQLQSFGRRQLLVVGSETHVCVFQTVRDLLAAGFEVYLLQDAVENGFAYDGRPLISGFTGVRQKGESLSIILILSDGSIAYGDCAAVQYSGAGGRDPLFLSDDFLPVVEEYLAEKLNGRKISSFREMAGEIEQMEGPSGERLHTALRYGVTQALLHAVAIKENKLMCEVVSAEYGTELSLESIPIFAQTGDERYNNADKAILKRADVLPHGLINKAISIKI